MHAASYEAVAEVFRAEAGHLTTSLVRILGDFDLAEEIVQDTLLIALERWPVEGIPRRPGAWLHTVARRLAINRLHRDARYRDKLALLAAPSGRREPDDRLRLIFTCCHPALGREAQVALTLRAVGGLTTTEIAHALVMSEAAVAQRIVRARRKIVQAGIPYQVPSDDVIPERLNEVLTVLYLVFNEGHLASGGATPMRRDLVDDAIWLTQLVCRLLPREPEPMGLLALMKLHSARAASRFDSAGNLVLLRDQDRSLWDGRMIADAIGLIEGAAALRRPGPFQLEAAIAACHAEAVSFDSTDWPQILALYDMLLGLAPSAVARLNRAIALRMVRGPEAALAEVDRLARELDGYYLFHATRGELLSELGSREQARAAQLRALELTDNVAERSLLARRLGGVPSDERALQ